MNARVPSPLYVTVLWMSDGSNRSRLRRLWVSGILQEHSICTGRKHGRGAGVCRHPHLSTVRRIVTIDAVGDEAFFLEDGKRGWFRFGSRGWQAGADGNAAPESDDYKDGYQGHEPPHPINPTGWSS
jgi:hypothetical protein